MIHLYGDYYVNADSNQYILTERHERVDKETGEAVEYFRDCGFYSNMGNLLKSFVCQLTRDEVQSGDVNDMQGWLEIYKQNVDLLHDLLVKTTDLEVMQVADGN